MGLGDEIKKLTVQEKDRLKLILYDEFEKKDKTPSELSHYEHFKRLYVEKRLEQILYQRYPNPLDPNRQ